MKNLVTLNQRKALGFLILSSITMACCTSDPFRDSIWFSPALARERLDAKAAQVDSLESDTKIEQARLNQMQRRLDSQQRQGSADKQTFDKLRARVNAAQDELADLRQTGASKSSDNALEQRRRALSAEVDRLDRELGDILEFQ